MTEPELNVPADGPDELEGNEPDEDTGESDEPAGEDPDRDREPDEPEAEEQVLDERALEKAAKRLEGAVGRYRKAVEAFVADTGQSLIENKTDLDFCPGYLFHPEVKPLDEEQIQFARVLLGEPAIPHFEPDPEARECERCKGWGRVTTGSKVNGQNLLTCRVCQGRGWTGERANLTPQQAARLETPPADVASQFHEPEVTEDNWGTPIGHPDFGKMPQYRDPGWLEALQAYKRGEPAPLR